MVETDGRRTRSWATLGAAAGSAVGLELLSRRLLRRYGEGLNSMPTVVLEEFPEIDRALLEKLSSFDAELGWCPQPEQTKQKDTGDHLPGEEVRTVVEYSTDEYGSRVCPAADRDESTDISISTYGDSYCFCREVDDDETFQHHLAEKLDTHVGNYGGGNYGLDQALMRLQRQYPEDPTDYVIVLVTASSIARILSVWKHYQEFGNVLAVKPRYRLDDGSLERVETPITEREDLLDLESYAEFLRSHDYHYDHWFKPHLARFPYATDLLAPPEQLRYLAAAGLEDVEGRLGVSLPGIDTARAKTRSGVRLEQPRVRYHEELYDRKADLFEAIVGEFVDYADQEEFTPVFAMAGQLRYAAYEATHGPIYGDLLDRLDERYPILETIDIPRHFEEADDPEAVESLYVQRGEGGHYSSTTNERIADLLAAELFD
ncbi:hypothetical protein MUK72_03150 [Halococcus dombrowskii]|uniref:Uncharacterized protein n=2 Tax=Halococcus dombrowskii TaxID=179637 RepID=A0AAX3AS22_HALDO|nr:hypothetical protein [Halococcus dombrowskii]UOO95712.1 hypothetical protein MUK72_03150 [Halococcus dombrowskii]